MNKDTFADKVLSFNQALTNKVPDLSSLPDVNVLNPFHNPDVQEYTRQFYNQYYHDHANRIFIFGINPGRKGAGVTGVPFTDPVNLEQFCGIHNNLDKKHELSSQFIYEVIEAFGGPQSFYARFYFTAVSPVGFTKSGKNLNYYDDRKLEQQLKSFIIKMIEEQLTFGAYRNVCLCLGEGKNFKYLQKLNQEFGCFDEILPLAHPRFILQYRRKQKEAYIDDYLAKLERCSNECNL